MAASDGTSSGIRYVCPSAACKFTFQRGNAGKNGRIAEHSSFLGTKITSCSSGGAADHPEPGGTGHGFSKKRASVKSGRGTSGSGKCSEHGHRTGCDECGSGQKLSGSCDSCSVCSDRCRTDAVLWDIVASLSSACSGGTAGF